jgi:N-acetylmuramoyl-L-alanine amidase
MAVAAALTVAAGLAVAAAQGQSAGPAANTAANPNAVPFAGAQAPGVAPAKGARFVVVIDAAHGGDDGGATLNSASGDSAGANTAEKTVTLQMSVRLRSLLMARGFQVVTTREGNVNLDNVARAQIANRAAMSIGTNGGGGGATACLSLHATEMGAGAHIYVSSLAQSGQARFIPWKTAQSAYVSRSLKLAGVVNSAFEHAGAADGGNGGGITATLGRTSLPGVDSMTCPAVAIEIAPIRGADHKVVTEVTDPDYQSKVVEALAAAMLEWKTDSESGADAGQKAGGQTP